jgi:hypothetical protein
MAYRVEISEKSGEDAYGSPTQKIPVVVVVTDGRDLLAGRILAVIIDSPIVGPVWFALDDDWRSGDEIPVFYASELPHLQKMSPEDLQQRYEQKIALAAGGSGTGKVLMEGNYDNDHSVPARPASPSRTG